MTSTTARECRAASATRFMFDRDGGAVGQAVLALDDHAIARGDAAENLDQLAVGQAELDHLPVRLVVVPDDHHERLVAVVLHRGRGTTSDRFRVRLGDDLDLQRRAGGEPRRPVKASRTSATDPVGSSCAGRVSTVTSCSAVPPGPTTRPGCPTVMRGRFADRHRRDHLELRGIDHAQDRIRRGRFDHVAGVVPALRDDAGETRAARPREPASAAAADAALSACASAASASA